MTLSRSEAAKVASNTRWAMEPDRRRAVAAANAGFRAKFERQVDPDGVLPPQELAKRTDNAIRAHMTRIGSRGRRKQAH